MKTKQDQVKEMAEKMKRCFEKNGLLNFKWFAEAIVQAGYGDISEYKAEIERLKAEVKQAQIDILNKVMTYINNKIENDYGDMSDSVNYLTIDIDDFDDFIDELIKEVQNAETKS